VCASLFGLWRNRGPAVARGAITGKCAARVVTGRGRGVTARAAARSRGREGGLSSLRSAAAMYGLSLSTLPRGSGRGAGVLADRGTRSSRCRDAKPLRAASTRGGQVLPLRQELEREAKERVVAALVEAADRSAAALVAAALVALLRRARAARARRPRRDDAAAWRHRRPGDAAGRPQGADGPILRRRMNLGR